MKTRNVSCIKITKEGHILNETSKKCDSNDKPSTTMECNLGDCKGSYFWRAKPWSDVKNEKKTNKNFKP